VKKVWIISFFFHMSILKNCWTQKYRPMPNIQSVKSCIFGMWVENIIWFSRSRRWSKGIWGGHFWILFKNIWCSITSKTFHNKIQKGPPQTPLDHLLNLKSEIIFPPTCHIKLTWCFVLFFAKIVYLNQPKWCHWGSNCRSYGTQTRSNKPSHLQTSSWYTKGYPILVMWADLCY